MRRRVGASISASVGRAKTSFFFSSQTPRSSERRSVIALTKRGELEIVAATSRSAPPVFNEHAMNFKFPPPNIPELRKELITICPARRPGIRGQPLAMQLLTVPSSLLVGRGENI